MANASPLICGIDLGLKGAFSFLDLQGNFVSLFSMPTTYSASGDNVIDINAVRDWYYSLHYTSTRVVYTMLERTHSFGTEMRKSIFTFGRGTGRVEAFLELEGFSYGEVMPQKWKAEILSGTKKDKIAAIGYASSRWPKAKIGKDHNKADALCIAEYARRIYTAQNINKKDN